MCYTVAWLKSLPSLTISLSSLFLSLYLSHFLSFSLHILAAIEGLISKTNYVVWGCISLALVQKNLNTSLLKKHYACFKNGSLITKLQHIFTDLPIIQHSLSWTLGWKFHLTWSITQNINFFTDAWMLFTAAILALSVNHMRMKCDSRAKKMLLICLSLDISLMLIPWQNVFHEGVNETLCNLHFPSSSLH